MCQAAPVIDRLGQDWATHFDIPETYGVPGRGGVYLGSVGDQSHQTRSSSHNCAPRQESPVNGVAYAPQYAHARDARPSSHAVGMEMVHAHLQDPRCRYVIYDGVGYKPDGSTWLTYHPTFHFSAMPGTHNDTRPFFGPPERPPLTDQQKRAVLAAARRMIRENPRRHLRAKRPQMRGADVREVQAALRAPLTGKYGPGTRDAVIALQAALGMPRTGEVNQETWVWVVYFAMVRALEGG